VKTNDLFYQWVICCRFKVQFLSRHGIEHEHGFQPKLFLLIVDIADARRPAPVCREMLRHLLN
jgi:hypothetical protein